MGCRSTRVLVGLCAALCLALAMAASASAAPTVWLCRPGATPDPCNPGLSTTVYSPTLQQTGTQTPTAVRNPKVDCFYVYPTVSNQPGPLATLTIDPEENSIALYQAARYSQYCKVYAPMYRQFTVPALEKSGVETAMQLATPYLDVQNAFENYLHKYNKGRPFILIGHSQGSFLLRQLITKQIDPKPSLRNRLVSAILMGGNVLVKTGQNVGGDFKHIPACTSSHQTGCVIAFSTYNAPPPSNSLFGRSTTAGESVLCTNPAALGGGSGLLNPIWPSAPFAPGTLIALGTAALNLKLPMPSTVWVSVPGAYSATCSTAGGADVLSVAPLSGAPNPTPSPDSTWGLHLLDANIALGNLLTDVSSQITAFGREHHSGPTPRSRVE
jgi:hypothetical protein